MDWLIDRNGEVGKDGKSFIPMSIQGQLHDGDHSPARPGERPARIPPRRRSSTGCRTRIPDTDYLARFTVPEFTSLCPVTGQPDFAILVIDYVPGPWLVESKSLKLYLHSFRNHGAFHEDCTVAIGKRLAELLEPRYLRIGGYWYPRGGIPIDVFWQTGELPKNLWLPDQGVAPYRAAAERPGRVSRTDAASADAEDDTGSIPMVELGQPD